MKVTTINLRAALSLGLIVAVGITAWCRSAASAPQGSDPLQILECGVSITGSSLHRTVGTKCTSSSNPDKVEEALDDANNNFMAFLANKAVCVGCPPGSTGCERTQGVIPNPPYSLSNCTVQYESGCQGNPLKTLITVTCTNYVIWIISCDYCTEPPE